jgi:hypothetical protein
MSREAKQWKRLPQQDGKWDLHSLGPGVKSSLATYDGRIVYQHNDGLIMNGLQKIAVWKTSFLIFDPAVV